MSLRDQLVAAMAVRYQDTEVKGVAVRVNALAAAQQLDLAEKVEEMSAGDITFWLLEQTIVDPETGERVFGDGDVGLRGLDGAELTRLADMSRKLNTVEESSKN